MLHESAEPTSRTVRKREERKKTILETAMALVTTGGLDSLTIGGLASRLDYTPGALYRYFASKEAIVVELQGIAIGRIDRELEQVMAKLAAAARAQGSDPADIALLRLYGAARFYAELPTRLPHELHLLQATVADPRTLVSAELAARVIPKVRDIFERISAEFDEAVRVGVLAPGPSLRRTVIYWSALQGVVQLDKLSRHEAGLFQVASLADELARALLLGWGATQPALDRALTFMVRS